MSDYTEAQDITKLLRQPYWANNAQALMALAAHQNGGGE